MSSVSEEHVTQPTAAVVEGPGVKKRRWSDGDVDVAPAAGEGGGGDGENVSEGGQSDRHAVPGDGPKKKKAKKRVRGPDEVCADEGKEPKGFYHQWKDIFTDREKLLEHVYGRQGLASVELDRGRAIRLSDVQNLLLWVLGQGMSTPWAIVKNKPLIGKFVLVYVSGIDRQLWDSKQGCFAQVSAIFGQPLTTIAQSPTTTPLQTVGSLLSVGASKTAQRKAEAANKRRRKEQAAPWGPEDYLMTPEQMRKYGCPLPFVDKDGKLLYPPGYVSTLPDQNQNNAMVAVDCEMCETAEGLELTRMSLVDENGNVLVDEYVKPRNPILDYLTQFSGITPKALAHVKTRLEDAQAMFRRYVSANTILVGHSLENDLKALKVVHRKLLDTVVLFPHPRGFPARSSLKVLAQKFLHKCIQNGSHDSVVDALTAMQLAKLKIKMGANFGTGERKFSCHAKKMVDVLHDCDVQSCIIDRLHIIQKHSSPVANDLPVHTDKEAVDQATTMLQSAPYRFLWCQLQDLGRFYSERVKPAGARPGVQDVSEACHNRILAELDSRIGQLYKALPTNTLMMVVTGQGDTSAARKAQEEKFRRQAGLDGMPPWSLSDEEHWAKLSQQVVKGLCFAKVKSGRENKQVDAAQ